MKTIVVTIIFFLTAFISVQAQKIKWLSWTEAINMAKTDEKPKKIFVDVYTDWCGWCKKMDKNTFNHPDVAKYMTENFYMVKMNAESKEDITYKGKTFKFIPQGRNGYHELAAALLQGKMSFPTVIFLTEDQQILSPVTGYQKPDGFLKIAKYFGDNIYKDKNWQEYKVEQSK